MFFFQLFFFKSESVCVFIFHFGFERMFCLFSYECMHQPHISQNGKKRICVRCKQCLLSLSTLFRYLFCFFFFVCLFLFLLPLSVHQLAALHCRMYLNFCFVYMCASTELANETKYEKKCERERARTPKNRK